MADMEGEQSSNSTDPQLVRPIQPIQAVPVEQAIVADSAGVQPNPYDVATTPESSLTLHQDDVSRYQSFRAGLILIIASHFGHISMVLLMLYIVSALMNIGSSVGGFVGASDGAAIGSEIGGGAGAIVASCCSWFFFIVTAPLNFIGGCMGFSIPDVTGANSKITGSVIAGMVAILGWVGLFYAPELQLFANGNMFFTYVAIMLLAVFLSHAFFVMALHDVGRYLGAREICSAGVATVAVCGVSFLTLIAGLGILMRLDGWEDSPLPGSSSIMLLLSGVLALVWLGMYLRMLFKALIALKIMGSRTGSMAPFPQQSIQQALPVSTPGARKGW